VGLEPTTGWIPLLVFGTSSSSSRTPSIIYISVRAGFEPARVLPQTPQRGAAIDRSATSPKAGLAGIEPTLLLLESSWPPWLSAPGNACGRNSNLRTP
jgi:hypothetical protein